MFVNQLISLLISVRFNFVFSWTNNSFLYSRYEMERRIIKENPNIIVNDICKANKQMWAAICKKTIQLLRKDDAPENPYRYSLYMNYHAFNFSTQCGIIKIQISSEQSVDQSVSHCYGRPSVIPSPDNGWMENWPHFNEISIYSGIAGTMMVFQCQGVDCLLLEWYNAEEWLDLEPVHNDFFQHLVPQTLNNNETDLASRLYDDQTVSNWGENSSNILWKSNIRERRKLCEVLYARAEYQDKIIFTQEILSGENVQKMKRTEVSLSFRPASLRDRIRIHAFTCKQFKIPNSSQCYKIMAGPGDESVILLEPLLRSHKAIEWVKNIYSYNSVDIDMNY